MMSAEKGHRIVHVPPDQIFGVSCEPRRWTDDAAMLLFWRRLNSMERVAFPGSTSSADPHPFDLRRPCMIGFVPSPR
jgi:hypothetical protein